MSSPIRSATSTPSRTFLPQLRSAGGSPRRDPDPGSCSSPPRSRLPYLPLPSWAPAAGLEEFDPCGLERIPSVARATPLFPRRHWFGADPSCGLVPRALKSVSQFRGARIYSACCGFDRCAWWSANLYLFPDILPPWAGVAECPSDLRGLGSWGGEDQLLFSVLMARLLLLAAGSSAWVW